MNHTQLRREIFQRIKLDEALQALNPRQHARYWALDCPACGASQRAFVYHGSDTIFCNRRDSCGVESSLIGVLTGRGTEAPSGEAFVDLLRDLAARAGIDPSEVNEHLGAGYAGACARDRVLRGVQGLARRGLAREPYALDYLRSRGISQGQAKDLGLGYFTPLVYKLAVDRYGDDLLGPGVGSCFIGHIVALGLDVHGAAVGMHGRFAGVEPTDVREKEMTKGGESKGTPFMLHEARRAGIEVVLVEGMFDALACHAHGEKRAAAVLGNSLTNAQSIALKQAGIVHAFLCLDPDGAGAEGTIRSIELLAKRGITASVVPQLTVEGGGAS